MAPLGAESTGRERIDVGRAHDGVAVAADVVGALPVGDDERAAG